MHVFRRGVVWCGLMVLTTAGGCGDTPTSPDDPGTFFENAGARLSYTVDRPAGTGPFPGIVLVHEGGPVGKGGLAALASTLTQRGFMVLRYDKRGVGDSTGTFEEVSVANAERVLNLLASDVVAAAQTLRQQNGIDAGRIGLVGASQAGWVMPIAASQTPVRFIAAIVGPTVSVGLLYRYADLAANGALTLDQLSQQIATFTGPAGYDPAATLSSLNVPIFWQMARDDRVVPTRECVAVIDALISAGKPFRVATYAGGHEVRTGQSYVPDLVAWLDSVR